ncbi:MAG: DedA family protein [Candidatus Omnitrophica bacterium]|nr:DedA family protein [Candidatus Omnitrophota bacterium]
MDWIVNFSHYFLHLDKYLNQLVTDYGAWSYGVLFLIVFCETGLVVTPVLPGDSLLFASGALAAIGQLDPLHLFFLLAAAAALGNSTNYWIGRFVGPKVFHYERSRFFNKKYLDQTHRFYEKHGGKTIVIAQFMPIIRTFAPFVAGIGSMSYARFLAFNIAGIILWISICLFSGYFFGNIPVVKQNFTLVILGIIAVSLIPAVIGFLRARRYETTRSTL